MEEILASIISAWMALAPGSRVMRDADYRTHVASAIVEASEYTGIDACLLAAVAYHESSFDFAARGARGEVGLMQVHGMAAAGCDLGSVEGQVLCGARWLARFQRCGEDSAMLTGYATGECSGAGPVTERRIMMRIRKAEECRKMYAEEVKHESR